MLSLIWSQSVSSCCANGTEHVPASSVKVITADDFNTFLLTALVLMLIRLCIRMQTFALMKKWSTMYWRSPAYNLTRFLMTTLIALFYGTMYLQKGHLPKSGMAHSG